MQQDGEFSQKLSDKLMRKTDNLVYVAQFVKYMAFLYQFALYSTLVRPIGCLECNRETKQ